MKKTIRFFSVRVAMTLLTTILFVMTAQTARAETKSVTYVNASGVAQPAVNATVVTSSMNILGTGSETTWYVVDKNSTVTINQILQIRGHVNLILSDYAELKVILDVNFCIYIDDESSLTIYCQSTGNNKGKLSVTGNDAYGVYIIRNSSLTINGGNISINSNNTAHGIYIESGQITINNGDVSITGGHNGVNLVENGTCNMTVNGGNVSITGSNGCNAISDETKFTNNGGNVVLHDMNGTQIVANYLDADSQKSHSAFELTNTSSIGAFGEEKWYILNENIDINEMLTISGNVHIILANNKKLTITNTVSQSYGIYISGFGDNTSSLTIHSQSTGDEAGELKITSASAIGVCIESNCSMTVNGGQISVNSYTNGVFMNETSSMTVNNGYVNITTTSDGSSAINNMERFQRTGGTVILNGNDISKAIPTVTAPTPNNLFYSGSAQALVTAGTTSHGTMVYSTDGTTYSETIPTGTNVRSYTVYYKVDAGDTWNAVAAQTIDVTIDKATPVVTPPTASTLLYTGEAQPLITTATTTFGTLLYSTDGTTYSETIPTGTEVGTYTVYYKVEGSDNWNAVAPQSVTVEIKQGTAYVNAAGEQQPILYAIPVTNSTTTLGTDGKTTWYVVDNSVTFNQTVDINGNVNLILADGKELKVGSPDSGYGIYLTDNSSLTVYAQSHGDSKGILTVSGSTCIRVGDCSLTINGGQLSVTGFNDGVYNETGRMTVNNGYVNIITTNISSSAINNLERLQRNGGTVILNGVDISKAIPTVTAPTPNSLFYSGSAQALVTAGTTSHGTMIYSTDGTTYSETIPTGTEIGTYTVYYKVDAGATWNAVAPQSVSVEIKLGTAYVNAAGEQQMVDAIPVTNSTAFLGTDGKTTWYVVDNSVTFNQMVYIKGNVNLILADGKELKVGIPDTDYGIYFTDNSSLTVYAQSHGDNKGILTVFGSTSIRVGDGSLTINGGQISVAGYNYGVSIGDAGLMTVNNGYVNITTTNMGSSATNNLERLQRTGGTVILNGNDISKAIPTVTAPTPNNLLYSGSAQALVTAGTTSHGTMVYSTDGTTYSETIPTGTNVRSYTVYYKVDGGDTWNAVAAQTIDVTIDKATPVVTIPAASTLLYTGEAQPLITTASTTFGTLLYSTDGTTYSETIPTGTEIDTYTVYYKVEGSDNWDEVEPQSVTVEIKLGTAYVNAAGETQPKVYAIPVTNSTDILGTDGKTMWYVVDNSVTLNQMVHIKGNVNLILADGKELKVGSPDSGYGIYLTDNSSLTVYAQSHGDNKGKLTVSGSTSISVRNCSLTINGGQISVTGFNDGVYIYENGHMTVNNGYVNIITTNISSSAINNLERLQRTGGTVMLNGNDISKAIPIVTAPTPKNLLYSGSAQALVTAGTTSHGTMVYSTDGTTYSETIPTATEAGTYIVFYKVDGGATWNAVPAQSFYVMIKPGTAYVNAAGEQQQRVDATPVTSSSADLGSAGQTTWYVVNNNITFDHSISISGDVNLILADGKELKVKSPNSDYGIYLDDNSSLTIYSQSHGESMGKLTATGGCGVSVRSGCLTINGGLINFRSETNYQSAVDIGNGGSMILNNGDVTAIGNGAQAINEPSKFYHNGGLLNGFNGTIVTESTTYLDATGASQSVTATVIQPGMQIGSPDEDTWYVAKGEVNFANGFSFIGHVNLILADGAKMTVNRSVSSLTSMTMGENKCLIIYSQSNGSSQGSLISDNIYISKSTANLTINGGNINVAGPENITGITVSDGSMTINGGQVTVTGGIIPGTNSRRPGVYFDNGTLTLGHNSTNDFILISSIENSNESLGTVNIKSGQHFVAEGGSTIVTGSGVDYAAVASQKLLPACAVTIADGITNGRVTADKSGVAIIADDKTVTLTVTPNEGYAIGSVKYNDGSDHAVEAVNGVYSFTAPAKDIAVTASFKKLLTNGITIGTIADQTCTGSEIKPAITVKDGMTDITGQCDFAFTDNTAVGTATVTITAKATSTAYAGEIATTFTIVREMSGLFADDNTWTGYVAQEDLTLPDGLTAYTVTALGKTTATAAALGYIPQGVPVLLSRTDKTANLYRASAGTGTEPTTNLLRVATTAKEVTVGECYVLYQDEFVLYGTGTLPAGTIYLPVGGTAGARRLSIGSGGDTTSMEDVRWQTEEGSGDWYSMDGRKLDGKPTKKGLYIHNGKKEVVK